MNIGRWEHHQLASLIASRDISDIEASALTGYSPYTISNLRTQKEFKSLVAHYLREGIGPPRPDASERMHSLGMTALEELQQRLEEDPSSFSKRELLEMSELLLIKAKALGERAATQGSPVKLAISFVPAQPVPQEPINILDGVSYSRGEDA